MKSLLGKRSLKPASLKTSQRSVSFFFFLIIYIESFLWTAIPLVFYFFFFLRLPSLLCLPGVGTVSAAALSPTVCLKPSNIWGSVGCCGIWDRESCPMRAEGLCCWTEKQELISLWAQWNKACVCCLAQLWLCLPLKLVKFFCEPWWWETNSTSSVLFPCNGSLHPNPKLNEEFFEEILNT